MFSTREIHMARNCRAEGWGSSGPSSPRPSAQAGAGPSETAKAAVETAAPEDRRKKERRSTVLTRRGLLLGDRARTLPPGIFSGKRHIRGLAPLPRRSAAAAVAALPL